MNPEQELEAAIELAKRLFDFRSFRRVDPTNVRLGPYWLGLSADETTWMVWQAGLGDIDDPSLGGTWLSDFETAHEAMGCVVGQYASSCYDDAVAASVE